MNQEPSLDSKSVDEAIAHIEAEMGQTFSEQKKAKIKLKMFELRERSTARR